MAPKIVQINFTFSGSRAEYEQANQPWAGPIADLPGLHWKIWPMNEAQHEAGGIYLFEDDATAQAFVDGPMPAALKNNPSLSNVSVKQFDVIEEFTAITRGPIHEGTRV
jgi:hypothetical protein